MNFDIIGFFIGFLIGSVKMFGVILTFIKRSSVDEIQIFMSVINKKTDKIIILLHCINEICDIIKNEKEAEKMKEKILTVIGKAMEKAEQIKYDELFCEDGKDENEEIKGKNRNA